MVTMTTIVVIDNYHKSNERQKANKIETFNFCGLFFWFELIFIKYYNYCIKNITKSLL